MMIKRYSGFMAWFVLVLYLYGCAPGEMEKTISLPQKEAGEEIGFNVKDIQEYSYHGHSEDVVYLSWGQPDSKSVYMLKLGEEGYAYQELDIQQKKVLNSTFVDDRNIMDVKIAPGGRYISYEVSENPSGQNPQGQLILFFVETGTRTVLEKWDSTVDVYSYVWSDDGTKLISWQIGDNYAKAPDADWKITRYDIDGVQMEKGEENPVKKEEFTLKSGGYGWRSVLPNADGSEIYVREEYKSYAVGSAKTEKADDEENVEQEPEDDRPASEKAAQNWMLIPESMTVKKLREFAEDVVYPVKYTKAGLYAQDVEGDLFLVENLKGSPVRTKIFKTENIEVYICENGDHIFLLEWINSMSRFQITGIRVEDGQAKVRQVLYKSDAGDEVDGVAVVDDRELIIRGCRYTDGNDMYSFKIMALEY